MPLRVKAFLTIIIIVFAITAANYLSSLTFTTSNLIETMVKDQSLVRDLTDNLISMKIDLLKADSSSAARLIHGAQSEAEQIDTMKALLEEFPDFMAFTIFDRSGAVASFGESPALLSSFGANKYLSYAFDGMSVISTTCHDAITGKTVFYVCEPIDNGMVLAATISGTFFADLLSEFRLWKTGGIYVIDNEGFVIAHYDHKLIYDRYNYIELAKTDPSMRSVGDFLARTLLSEEGGTENYTFYGEERVCSYKHISSSMVGWVICVVAPLNESPVATMRSRLFFSALLFLAVGIIIAIFVSGAAVRPFYKIEAQNANLEELNETVTAQTAKIQKAHDQAKLLLDAMPFCCHLWNNKLEMFDCNEANVTLFKTKDKQDFICGFYDLSPEYQPDGRFSGDTAQTYINKAFEEGKFVFEWMHRAVDGTPLPMEITLVRVPYEDDFVVAAYLRDLREHKRMMSEIEQRQNLLKAVNCAAVMLLATDAAENTGNIESSIIKGMELVGRSINVDRVQIWKNREMDGQLYFVHTYEWHSETGNWKIPVPIGLKFAYGDVPNWKEMFSRGEYINAPLSQMPQADQEFLSAYEIKSVVIIPLFLQDRFWGFFSIDDCERERTFTESEINILQSASLMLASAVNRSEIMTSLYETSELLESALKEMQEANSAKSSFLANMSHEMRTPLNAVIGLSELILNSDGICGETEDKLEKIHNSGMTLLNIINDILDISKIESGKFEITSVEYDTPSLINDTVTLNAIRIGEKPVTFKLFINETLPYKLFGDDLRVKQVFNNLLSNAFKYTNSGVVEWRVSCERDGDSVWLVFSVKDSGIGIKPQDLKNLFSDYNQVNVKTNRKIEGTGLGLAITKRLVEMMGGTISVESEYGKGTTFHVRLRQKFVSDTPIGKNVAENLMDFSYTASKRDKNAKFVRIDMSYARVLVVDDNAVNLDVAKGMMKPYRMQIDCVASGQQAIDVIRAEKVRYNAIFMDHMMPEMDGVEAAGHIREIDTEYAKKIPIIALTANAIAGNEEMFLSKGFQAFLSKPIEISRLDEIIRRLIRDKAQEKPIADRQTIALSQNFSEAKEEKEDTPLGILPDRRILSMKISGLNIDKGIEQIGGDESVYFDVLRSYAANTPLLLEKIRGVSVENLSDFAISVHGIKGSSRSICADIVADMAEKLEIAAKSGDYDFIAANNAPFMETAWKLVRAIDEMFMQINKVNQKPAKEKPDSMALNKILEACRSYDMDTVEAGIKELEGYEYETGGELVPWLWENVQQFNIEQIVEKLAGMN